MPFHFSSDRFDFHAWRCAVVLRQGGVIAYPTEGVWGLGCDPWDRQAVWRLLQLKQRTEAKGLILISGDAQHFEPLLRHLPEALRQQVLKPRPRATTWLVPDAGQFAPLWLKGAHASIAIRLSRHRDVQRLTRQWGRPLVSTSANLSGHPAARSALEVRQYFHARLDAILPGHTGADRSPSQIIDLSSGRIVRA
jgi:L-threonylcarbamoyladenylate synthase